MGHIPEIARLYDKISNLLNYVMPMPKLHNNSCQDLHAYLCCGMFEPLGRRKGTRNPKFTVTRRETGRVARINESSEAARADRATNIGNVG